MNPQIQIPTPITWSVLKLDLILSNLITRSTNKVPTAISSKMVNWILIDSNPESSHEMNSLAKFGTNSDQTNTAFKPNINQSVRAIILGCLEFILAILQK